MFLANISPSYAEGSGGGGSGDIGNGDVYVGAYYPIPGTGEWASFDTGIPTNPREFMYEPKCFAGDVGDIVCLNENERVCAAGARGKLVYWFTRLKESGNPWALMDPPNPSCIYAEKPRDVGDQIRENILTEFQSRPIAAGTLSLQPSPHTLIGAHTNFYVEAGEQVFDFVMLEQNIRIVASPSEYEWHYGDRTVYGPASQTGSPLPADRWGEETSTSHVYRETGNYQASVTVHFSAEYSINGGPMVPIDGRAAVPSAPVAISVWKSESHNVADDCRVNPAGYGC
ncbi:hypothetical protein [Arthrobacter gengyunqii]|uniref:PKD domain-containing protein n=1 Tax=Arthrobacter gengyunqii TaxID=2886940 RepID=A0ABS8GJK5_9MICC|nr:hypothetical protein [Arthrobacter gengyunqii]MCC3265428.1 hypothetical protein [Arthrobacter gengyunqii]